MIISPTQQYVNIFNVQIYFYGIILALATLIGFLLANKLEKSYYNTSYILEQSFYVILSGILGARLYFCLLSPDLYINNPLRCLNIREGGLSIHGAIFMGLITIFLLSKKYKYDILNLLDIYAVVLPLSQAIGRFGNFFNSEAFGTPTNSLLKLYITPEYRPLEYSQYQYFHPTFLYEALLDFFAFIFIYKHIFKHHYKTKGLTTSIYLITYSLIRLIIEPVRIDCTSYILKIKTPIIISIILLCLGLYGLFVSLKTSSK